MKYYQLTKRFLLLSLFFFPFLLFGQAEKKDTITLSKGLWVSGLEGGMSYTSLKSGSYQSLDKGSKYTFNFNSGFFVKENWASGLSFKLSKTSHTYSNTYSNQEEVYFGPWLRYYFKFQNNWFVYPELGLSYGGFYSENVSTIDNQILVTKGSGPGVNPGIGIVYFVNNNTAFTIRWNYQANLLSGQTSTFNDLGSVITPVTNVVYGSSTLLFGFQLYINEFFF